MTNVNPVAEFTKIGNYAIPAFAAFITAALAATVGDVAILFGVYTIGATIIAYAHRLAWLRRGTRGDEPRYLPLWQIAIFLVLHIALLGVLIGRLWNLGKL
ncbi:MAG: hypothetical protein J7L66_02445 [Anaerolineaceae bacterium]|nr:hypothetical protein [Anaerolineaceae bacterium]